MSSFIKRKLKDGRQIRGRYSYNTNKVCISQDDFEELLNEVDVAYEQAIQLQTIIENLQDIKAEAVRKVLDQVRTEIEQYNQQPSRYPIDMYSVTTVLQIIDKYKTVPKSIEA